MGISAHSSHTSLRGLSQCSGSCREDWRQPVCREISQCHCQQGKSCQQCGYVQAFLDHYEFRKYFDDIEMAGRTGLSKGENISLVIQRNPIEKAVYVGDTAGDQEAAELAGVPFIYAAYGFGDVSAPAFMINQISDLQSALKEIFI